jgi:hypothetical protein
MIDPLTREHASMQTLLSLDLPFEFGRVNVRLDRYAPLTPLKDLKSNLVEKFVAVRDVVSEPCCLDCSFVVCLDLLDIIHIIKGSFSVSFQM